MKKSIAPYLFVLPAAVLSVFALQMLPARAQTPVVLMEAAKPNQGWEFSNGQEFPGATGGLAVDPTAKQNGRDSLKLSADFTKGGAYVAAFRNIDKVDIKELSFWVRNPDKDSLTLRVNDASGQTHQIVLKTDQSPEWQRIVLPLQQWFEKRGTADAVTGVTKYEYWGGGKDGKWHGPATQIAVIVNAPKDGKVRTVWLSDLSLTPRAVEAPKPQITSIVRLDEFEEGEHDWRIWMDNKVTEKVTVVKESPVVGGSGLKFAGDFTGGGGYAAIDKDLSELGLKDITAIRLQYKTDSLEKVSVRFTDGTGQTHQKKGIPVTPDGQWHELVIKPSDIAGIEHWGGANDGVWHGEPQAFVIIQSAGIGAKAKTPELLLADIRAEAVVNAVAQPASFSNGFETVASLPKEWGAAGNTSIDTTGGFKGKNSLLLARSLADINKPVFVFSPTFAVTPGQWQFSAGVRSELKSADASYSGTVDLEITDAAGKVLDKATLADVFGPRAWQPFARTMELPKGAKNARFVTQINKAEGKLWVDELSAAYLAPAPKKDNRIERMVFETAQMGNLLFPTDARTVGVTVQANKPLKPEQMTVTYEVRDYWGAEQSKPATLTLERKDKQGQKYIYAGKLDLATVPLEIGRYYEVHASVPREGSEPFTNYTSLAILPEAETKKFKPEEIPFTSRSWDNRVPATITLSDRIGIRIAGIWGGWSEKAPYTPHAPTLDVAKKLGMGWLTGTPASTVEQGKDVYNETAFREGVRNFIKQFGDTRPLYVNLGNEPHGKGDAVLKNVEAYRVIYEEIKKVDPTIPVIATSVEPNEEYFKAGYGKYCDAYDFHIYETPDGVRETMKAYRALMKKYDVVRPLWSTELGLNSQGLPRQAVAEEVFKKFTAFFAEGGANVSWFGMLYPDGEGKLTGSSGEAHNVFDTRYNRYAPKLDAVAYYNAVNAIAIKKFAAEKLYPNGVRSTLFRDRDGRSLQILWKDKGRTDIAVPLPGVNAVQTIGIDGRRGSVDAGGKAATVSIGESPLLLLYQGGPNMLPEALGTPAISLESVPPAFLRGATSSVVVALGGASADSIGLVGPPLWAVKKTVTTKTVRFDVTAPEDSVSRQADFVVTQGTADKHTAELAFRAPVAGQLSLTVLPVPAQNGKPAAIKLLVTNNGTQPQTAAWDVALPTEQMLSNGDFTSPSSASAYFAETRNGTVTIAGGATAQISAPLAAIDPLKIYSVRAGVTDATGRALNVQRSVGGFALAPKAKAPVKVDGVLDEASWAAAPVQNIDQAAQLFKIAKTMPDWKGVDDLSAKLRFLWDDKYLYMGVQVKDDIGFNGKSDSSLWGQDGLQFLVDPTRASAEKVGKYDYSAGLGTKGPQVWSHLSASSATNTGEAKDVLIATKKPDTTGAITYEIAFPWIRLAPFEPKPGADLGLTIALNEDDGPGRMGFMTWFGNVQSKQIDTVGDVVLGD